MHLKKEKPISLFKMIQKDWKLYLFASYFLLQHLIRINLNVNDSYLLPFNNLIMPYNLYNVNIETYEEIWILIRIFT